MKKIVYGLLGLIVLILALVITAVAFAGKIVTNEFLVTQIEAALNVRANVTKVNINLLSVLSSIEVEGIALGVRDSYANEAKPLSERPEMKSAAINLTKVDLKVSFVELLKGKFQLDQLILKEPDISVVLFEDGGNNLTPLFKPPLIVAGQPNPALTPEAIAEKKKEEEEKAKEKLLEEPSAPFTAKDIPVAIKIGFVGIKNGNIEVVMKKTSQVIKIKALELGLKDIDIDGSNLEAHNSVDVNFDANLIIIGKNKEESSKFLLDTSGKVAPFVVKTGLVNPVVTYKVTMLAGSFMSGFAAFDSIAGELPLLNQAGLKMDKIAEKAELNKDVTFNVSYGNGKVTFLDDPTFPSKNYDLQIVKGSYIIVTNNNHEMNMGILYEKNESKKSIDGVDAKIKEASKGQGNPVELRNKLLGNLIKNDRINIPFRSYGDIRNPGIELGVAVGSISDLIGGAVKDAVKGKIGEELKKVPGSDALKKLF